MSYIKQFFGHPSLPNARKWKNTIDGSKDLWFTSQNDTNAAFDRKQQEYGLKDRINGELINLKKERQDERNRIIKLEADSPNRLYNPFLKLNAFDGAEDVPVEVLHVVLLGVVKYLVREFMSKLKPAELSQLEARWRAFNIDGLNMPPLQAKYMVTHYKSFVGKEFCIVLQAAPFVFFPFMTQEKKDTWLALCKMSQLVFMTHIRDMDEYLYNLTCYIDQFLFHVSKMSGRWANKPKFHMLKHLPQSIKRFGNASLFATEKFESYNGIIRNSSIHSNRLSPGRDIAKSFTEYQIMRHLLSGSKLYDHVKRRYIQAAPEVTSLFKENPMIQKAMGYNPEVSSSRGAFPARHGNYPQLLIAHRCDS
jgi:hypothetical protein